MNSRVSDAVASCRECLFEPPFFKVVRRSRSIIGRDRFAEAAHGAEYAFDVLARVAAMTGTVLSP